MSDGSEKRNGCTHDLRTSAYERRRYEDYKLFTCISLSHITLKKICYMPWCLMHQFPKTRRFLTICSICCLDLQEGSQIYHLQLSVHGCSRQ